MPITSTIYEFTEANIKAHATQGQGVYALYRPLQTVIYYGKSDGEVPARLLSHLNGHEGTCTKEATHFNTEFTFGPAAREQELLKEHRLNHGGRLPSCNDQG